MNGSDNIRFAAIKRRTLFDILIDYRYPVCIGVFLVLVAFQVHGISLSAWDAFFPYDTASSYIGKSRDVASDMWALSIPQYMSQIENGFPLFNYDLTPGGANAVMFSLPSLEPAILFGKSSFWGYYLFGAGAGTAWRYWFCYLGLLLSSYEVIFYLTNNKKISATGAITVAFSPCCLWWTAYLQNEILLYSQMMLAAGLSYLERFEVRRYRLISLAVAASAAVGFITSFMPALQVPLGIMTLLFAIYAIRKAWGRIHLKKWDIVCLAGAIIFSVALVARLLWLSRDAIAAMMATVYPGVRFENGGTGTGMQAFYSVYQYLLPFSDGVGLNNCEAASFLPVWPAVLIAFPWIFRKCREKGSIIYRGGLIYLLYGYFIFGLAWLLFRFPDWFARGTLFYNVTGTRFVWTMGVLSVYLACAALSSKAPKPPKMTALLWSSIVAAALLLLLQKGGDYLAFLGGKKLLYIGGMVFVFALTAAILLKSRWVFAAIALVCAVSSIVFINPLSRGVGAITDKELSQTLRSIDAEDPDAYWVYAEEYPYNNFLAASGLRSFNSTDFYMDRERWSQLDPEGKYEEYYNRCCHVNVTLGEQLSFELPYMNQVSVTLTAEDLAKLGIDYVVSNHDLSTFEQLHEGVLTEKAAVNGTRIYKVDKEQAQKQTQEVYLVYDMISDQSLAPAAPLTGDTVYEQTFSAQGDHLKMMQVMFGTYGRTNLSSVRMEITGAEGVIYATEVDCSQLLDNAATSFDLEDVPVHDGEEYTITFDPIGDTESDFVTIYQAAEGNGEGLALRIYCEEQQKMPAEQ